MRSLFSVSLAIASLSGAASAAETLYYGARHVPHQAAYHGPAHNGPLAYGPAQYGPIQHQPVYFSHQSHAAPYQAKTSYHPYRASLTSPSTSAYRLGRSQSYGPLAHSAPKALTSSPTSLWNPKYQLRTSTFAQHVFGSAADDIWVVAFMDPTCRRCAAFAPEWAELSGLGKDNPKVKFAHVDVSDGASQELIARSTFGKGVQTTPSVAIFAGDIKQPYWYEGDAFERSGLLSWIGGAVGHFQAPAVKEPVYAPEPTYSIEQPAYIDSDISYRIHPVVEEIYGGDEHLARRGRYTRSRRAADFDISDKIDHLASQRSSFFGGRDLDEKDIDEHLDSDFFSSARTVGSPRARATRYRRRRFGPSSRFFDFDDDEEDEVEVLDIEPIAEPKPVKTAVINKKQDLFNTANFIDEQPKTIKILHLEPVQELPRQAEPVYEEPLYDEPHQELPLYEETLYKEPVATYDVDDLDLGYNTDISYDAADLGYAGELGYGVDVVGCETELGFKSELCDDLAVATYEEDVLYPSLEATEVNTPALTRADLYDAPIYAVSSPAPKAKKTTTVVQKKVVTEPIYTAPLIEEDTLYPSLAATDVNTPALTSKADLFNTPIFAAPHEAPKGLYREVPKLAVNDRELLTRSTTKPVVVKEKTTVTTQKVVPAVETLLVEEKPLVIEEKPLVIKDEPLVIKEEVFIDEQELLFDEPELGLDLLPQKEVDEADLIDDFSLVMGLAADDDLVVVEEEEFDEFEVLDFGAGSTFKMAKDKGTDSFGTFTFGDLSEFGYDDISTLYK